MTKDGREDTGFFDSSVFEATKRTGDENLKRFLRDGLKNTSVTCVLVGSETSLRRWVRYELLQSFICGNGILAVQIHQIANLEKKTCTAGGNPLKCIAFTVDGDRVKFKEYTKSGWVLARDVGSMPLKDVQYDLQGMTNHTFECLFSTYDYAANSGYQKIGSWIETAAAQAGR